MSESEHTPPHEVSLAVRFWSRVEPFDVRDRSACAMWLGHRLPAGYGTLTGADGVHHYAHRVSWELIHGPVPEGMVIRHRCNTPSCVRPGHLQVGTYADNEADKNEENRHRVLPALTRDDIKAIRHCYRTGRWSQGDLALMFLGSGRGQPTIHRVVTGRAYVAAGGPITRSGRGKPPKRRAS